MEDNKMQEDAKPFDEYDFVVIGGGSGGLAAAKEAADLGAKVALLDYVRPSPVGSTWMVGGTCVNVGCIPKKLFHHGALLGEQLDDAESYGWSLQRGKHDWSQLRNAIAEHIATLNWGYRAQLREKKVKYFNAQGKFVNPHKLECTMRSGKKFYITGKKFLIAVGGRPKYPKIEGAEKCISSDDIFSLEKAPGKTLVIGASYVALECAGFLQGLGFDVTVMVRSIFLRGFDQECAEQIGNYMADHNTNFIRPATPTKIEHLDNGKKRVHYLKKAKSTDETGVPGVREYDTVLFAIGRTPETHLLNLDAAGVTVNEWGKIEGKHETTNVPHIHALGDIFYDTISKRSLELTPVAIKAGILLSKRLFGNSKTTLNYEHVPTTVFTPIEYGTIGLSEEEAIKRFGDNAVIYHAYYTPLEWTITHRTEGSCYVKLIVNKADNERIVGYHVLGPHAGEVTQGFALGFKLGATKEDLDDVIGIHPTVAEEVTTLTVVKGSGADPTKTGC